MKKEADSKTTEKKDEQKKDDNRPGWIGTLEKLRTDNKRWVFISGFLAGDVEKDRTRIYLDASLQQALDIPQNAILHKEEFTGTNLLGGVYAWIDQDCWGNCLYRYVS